VRGESSTMTLAGKARSWLIWSSILLAAGVMALVYATRFTFTWATPWSGMTSGLVVGLGTALDGRLRVPASARFTLLLWILWACFVAASVFWIVAALLHF
jgi:hypothetical protein